MKFFLVPSVVGQHSEQQFLSSYVVNDVLCIDAGSIGFYPNQALHSSLKHIFLTHTHIDHMASLPIFIDNVYRPGNPPVTIHCAAEVASCLREDFFNDRVWPNVFVLPSADAPFARLEQFVPGQSIEIAELRVTPIPVDHLVPTVGFIVEDTTSAVVFGADSGPTTEIWEWTNANGNVKAVILEVAFPNDEKARAERSKHLTPETFASEVSKIRNSPRILAVHLKPCFRDTIVQELAELRLSNVEVCIAGKVYHC